MASQPQASFSAMQTMSSSAEKSRCSKSIAYKAARYPIVSPGQTCPWKAAAFSQSAFGVIVGVIGDGCLGFDDCKAAMVACEQSGVNAVDI